VGVLPRASDISGKRTGGCRGRRRRRGPAPVGSALRAEFAGAAGIEAPLARWHAGLGGRAAGKPGGG
jgi:hypothetical protein